MKTTALSTQKKIVVIVATLIVAGSLFYFATNYFKTPLAETNWYIVSRHDITQKVSFTAQVNPVHTVDLAFARQGAVSDVSAHVGEKVAAGEVLAVLTHGDISAQVALASANVDVENARLALLLKGTRTEDVAVTQASLDAANTTLSSAAQTVGDKTRDAFTSADDALHNQLSGIFTNPDTTDPRLSLLTSNSAQVTSIQVERSQVGVRLAAFKVSLDANTDTPNMRLTSTEMLLREEITFLDSVATLLSGVIPDSSNSQVTISGYRTSTNLARTNLNASLSSVISAEQSYANAKAAVTVAERQLALKQAPATNEDVSAETARVESSKASLQSAEAELAKTRIVAPFAGVATRVDAKRGAVASPNIPVITLISMGAYQIEGYLSEVDVAKVKTGDRSEVTVDAFGADRILSAHVASVDPAPIMQNNVPSYKAVITLDKDNDPGVKPGMHANVTILTAIKKAALSVPAGAIVTKLGETYVEKKNDNGSIVLTQVKTGLTDDYIEIVSGVNENDRIASFGIMSVTQ